MANRTTVKTNIQALNVPSVSNAKLEDMLNDNICDNVVFKEDVTSVITTPFTSIGLNFAGYDRINLTRTGGSLSISVSNVVDGQVVYVDITKTAGQSVSWINATDITPVVADVTAASRVLYEIVRKNTFYYARAFVAIGAANESRKGLIKWASDAQTKSGTDTNSGDALAVRPSLMRDNVVFFTQGSDSRTLFNGTNVIGRAMFIWSKTASPNGWIKVSAPGLTFSW